MISRPASRTHLLLQTMPTAAWVVHLQAVMGKTLACLQPLLQTLCSEGFGPLQSAYTDAWLHTDQKVGPPAAPTRRYAGLQTILGLWT